MEDEPDTSAPTPPSPQEDAEAEDTTPQDAPAEPTDDPDEDEDEDEDEDKAVEGTPASSREGPPSATHDLPRTTTTGDDAEDLRSAGDGAVSAAPGDDLDDSGQRRG